ncbi:MULTISPECIES: MaoC family dehydratase [Achromobacter]|uniref:MaoC family dehydratase n=1 Tax=Achromobacter spanius TaxID=217203 RepID=A0AA42IZJ8_9BURK|nr:MULTISPECIES: MaoC family dehydratase [Achromobacter]MCS3507693.1 acyl dehydratase [Achromobacter sp. JUb104]MDH0736676.1 MaoC family dehydratase [Achromobacter spanius]
MTTDLAQPLTPPQTLAAQVSQEIGVSDWLTVTQAQVDLFADATGDHQFIHVDPARATRESAFGGPIAHGFLSLSLLTRFSLQVLPVFEGAIGINYGFDKVRFLTPVPVGARIRGRFVLSEFTSRNDREFTTRYAVTVEIEGAARPALVADWITMTVLQG